MTVKEVIQNGLPAGMRWLFPEYEFTRMDVETHRGVIIERILERGNWEQIRWLFSIYGEHRVADWVKAHGFRLLSKRSFALWCLVLDIDMHEAPAWAIEAKKLPEAW